MDSNKTLKELIKYNRSSFDTQDLPEGHVERFKDKLLGLNIKKIKIAKSINWKFIAIAASIAFVIMSMINIYNYGKNKAFYAMIESNNNQMRETMILSLIENQSPSKRLKAVNYIEECKEPADEIISALIKTLNYDDNSNVRLSTALGLSRFAYRLDVRQALANALIFEKDPNVQIEIINIVVAIKDKNAIKPMKEMLNKEDLPEFIKEQIQNGIDEIAINKI